MNVDYNRKVEIADFDPEWFRLYKAEELQLVRIFRENLVEIHHIGSTSIAGLAAKPIIDIMPVVKNMDKVDELTPQMGVLGCNRVW